MKVLVTNQQKDLPIRALSAKAIVKEVLANEDFKTDELSIHFVSAQKICTLHQDFFNDPTLTDCITFPMDDVDDEGSGYHVLGEIFICPQTAIRYLQQKNDDELSPYHETTLYLVHGLLHLLGYNDLVASERKKMRSAEQRHMKLLLKNNLSLTA